MKSINSDDIKIIKSMTISGDESYALENWLKPLIYGLNPKKIRDTLSINLVDIFFMDIDGGHPKFAYLEAGPPNKDKDINFAVHNYSDKIYDYPIIYPTNELALKVAKWLTLQSLFTKGLIRYPTYSDSLFEYFYIEIYNRDSNWKGIQKYQIRCKNDDEICYRFDADTERDLFTLTESGVRCISDFLNNPESPLHSHVSEDYIKGGEGPMFDSRVILDKIESIKIEYTNYEAKGDLFPITLNEIAKYVDIVDLDKETDRNILFKGTINGINSTIDIFAYRSKGELDRLDKNATIYPYSTLAVQLVKFVVIQELHERKYLNFPHDKINYTNGIQSFWKLEEKENKYVVLNSENKVCFKLQYVPKQSILKFPVIEMGSSNKTEGKEVHITNPNGACVYDKKEEKEKERKGMFNHKFGKVRGSVLALSYDGKIAVKKTNTEDYVRYNAETSTVENIKDFVINDSKWFFMVPATEVEVGDIIKYNDGFYQVVKVNEDNISAINLMNSTMTTIVKETIFGMSCYAKVISLIDPNTFGDGTNGMMAMMMLGDDNMDIKELMMLQMMTNGKKDNKDGQVNPMMMMFLMDDDMTGDDDMLNNMLMFNMMNGNNGFDMSNMFQNPMMMMMLLKDGNGGKMDKMVKFMFMSQMMNNQKDASKEEAKSE